MRTKKKNIQAVCPYKKPKTPRILILSAKYLITYYVCVYFISRFVNLIQMCNFIHFLCVIPKASYILLWSARPSTKFLCGATAPLGISCRLCVRERVGVRKLCLLPEPTHYCTISHRNKTPKPVTKYTLLPRIKKYKKANKIKSFKIKQRSLGWRSG
jgi:hypothetical protein